MKYLAILSDSFRQAMDSKVLYVTLGLSALLFLLVITTHFEPVPASETAMPEEFGEVHYPAFAFGLLPLEDLQIPLPMMVYVIEMSVVNNLGGIVILMIGIVISAFFIPNMLQKGSVELFLVKPMSRPLLLIFKYIGGLSFVFINSVVAIGGVWLALGIRTGIWAPEFLLTILVTTFFFAILYAISTFFAVLWRNSIICIFVTIFAWFFFFVMGSIHSFLHQAQDRRERLQKIPAAAKTQQSGDDTLDTATQVFDTIQLILPRTVQMNEMTGWILAHGVLEENHRKLMQVDRLREPKVAEILTSSAIYIVVLLGLSCWLFTTRDY